MPRRPPLAPKARYDWNALGTKSVLRHGFETSGCLLRRRRGWLFLRPGRGRSGRSSGDLEGATGKLGRLAIPGRDRSDAEGSDLGRRFSHIMIIRRAIRAGLAGKRREPPTWIGE
jgi:hypothetical protein